MLVTLQHLVRHQPTGKTTRAAFEAFQHASPWRHEFTYREGKVVVTQNYRCHGSYGPKQIVEYSGLSVIFYGPGDTRFQQATRLLTRDDAPVVTAVLEEMRAEALGRCDHARSVRVRNTGRCLNVWRCADCGHEYEVDSSD